MFAVLHYHESDPLPNYNHFRTKEQKNINSNTQIAKPYPKPFTPKTVKNLTEPEKISENSWQIFSYSMTDGYGFKTATITAAA